MATVPIQFDGNIRSALRWGSRIGRVEMTFIPAANLSNDENWPDDGNAAKALFMTEVARIVDEGDGMLTRLESGMLELRLATGQVFHLGEHSVTRLA
jgi:hypothetical protein